MIAIFLRSFRNDQRDEATTIGTRRQIELKEALSLSLSLFSRFYDRMSSPNVMTKGQKRSYDKSHFAQGKRLLRL